MTMQGHEEDYHQKENSKDKKTTIVRLQLRETNRSVDSRSLRHKQAFISDTIH